MKQKSLSRWLRAAIVFVGLFGLFVYAFVLPFYGAAIAEMNPGTSHMYIPWLVFLSITAIPCYAALVLAWLVAVNIGDDRSFSVQNAVYLRIISFLAAGDTLYFFCGNIVLLLMNMNHPGVLIFSVAIDLLGIALSIAAAVLSRLIRRSAVLQDESDLTI